MKEITVKTEPIKSYRPHKRVEKILDYAFEKIKSVNYKPSTRWAFYRVYQKFGLKKSDVNNFDLWTSRARKRWYKGWRPWTLADSVRATYFYGYGHGYKSVAEWIEKADLRPYLEKISTQDYYIQLWYEAQAMHGQFAYFTSDIPLIPFRGDISIPLKWEISDMLNKVAEKYKKPIRILYFGDLDPKGGEIPKSALKDVVPWCNIDFKVFWCGLTKKQAVKYNLPENPEKPNQYQWEALSDKQAGEIIQTSINKFFNKNVVEKVKKKERAIGKKANESLKRTFSSIL